MRPQHWLYTIPLRLRSLFRRRRVEQELNEELQFHLERKTRKASPMGFPQRRHAMRRCARWTDWNNVKRR